MELTRITRKYAYLTLTATDADGNPVTVTDVAVALLPPHARPSSTTEWTPVPLESGRYRLLLAGPDAPATDALVLPGSIDLWARDTDSPEVDAVNLGRITIA